MAEPPALRLRRLRQATATDTSLRPVVVERPPRLRAPALLLTFEHVLFGGDDRQRIAPSDRCIAVKAEPLSSDTRGSVTVEYTVLLVAVAMSCAFAMVTLGAPLVRMFLTYQTWLLLPFP